MDTHLGETPLRSTDAPLWGVYGRGPSRQPMAQCLLGTVLVTLVGSLAYAGASPARPNILDPLQNATDCQRNLTLTATAFAGGSGSHEDSDWEVYEDSGLTQRVVHSLADDTNLTSITIDDANVTFEGSLSGKKVLAPGTEYWARVRYRDDTPTESTWSIVRHFTTGLGSPPDTPSITSPTGGETDVSRSPAIDSDSFSDPDGDTHASSDWEVFDNSGLTQRVCASMSDATNTLNIQIDAANVIFEGSLTGRVLLAPETDYWVRVTHRDEHGLASSSAAVQFTTHGNNAPSRPSISSPLDKETSVSLNPTIIATAFSDSDGDPHGSSDWGLFEDRDRTLRVASSLNDTGNLTTITIDQANVVFEGSLAGQTQLAASTTYYIGLVYRDEYGGASVQSNRSEFTTTAGGGGPPDQPSITSPAPDAVGVNRNPTLAGDAYSDPDVDPHASSDWEVYADAGLATLVASSMADTSNLTSIVVSDADATFAGPLTGKAALAPSTDYWARVRYRDDTGLGSSWSTAVHFTTGVSQPPTQPSIADPTTDETGVDRNSVVAANAFSDPEQDTHASSDWEVFENAGQTLRVASSMSDGTQLTSITIDIPQATFEGSLDGRTALAPLTEYWVRVSYRDEHGATSTSVAQHFTTGPNLVPDAPSVTSPVIDEIDVNRTPTVTANTFSDPDDDQHVSSDWEVFEDAPLSNRVAYSVSDTANLATITVGPTDMTFEGTLAGKSSLDPTTDYWVRVTYRDTYGGVATSGAIHFTTVANTVPDTPSITSPTADATGVSTNPNVIASVFTDPDLDAHVTSDWEVYESDVFIVANRVASSYTDGSYLTNTVIDDTHVTFEGSLAGQTELATSTEYWARIRYRDTYGGDSGWAVVHFTTTVGSGNPPDQPSVTSPAPDATGVGRNPTVTSSAFNDIDGSNHASSDWEIYADDPLTLRVAYSLVDPTDLESITVSDVNVAFQGALAGEVALAYSTEYWLRVRYRDDTGKESAWSAKQHFTTGLGQAPTKPVITFPTQDQTGVAQNPTILADAFIDAENDAHIESDWEIFEDLNLTQRVASSLNDGVNLTSIDVTLANVTFEGTLFGLDKLGSLDEYWVVVTYRDESGRETTSDKIHFTTVPDNQDPDKPSITYPGGGALGIPRDVVVTASPYNDPDADAHVESDWEVFEDAALLSRIAYSLNDGTYLTQIELTSPTVTFQAGSSHDGLTALNSQTDYYVRVTYRDARGGVATSDEVHFVSGDNLPPFQPAITSPVIDATGVSRNPPVSATGYGDPEGDLHDSSDWEVYGDVGLTLRVASSLSDGANKTSITMNPANATFSGPLSGRLKLAPATEYWIRARYRDEKGALSAWTSKRHFTTLANAMPGQPTIDFPVMSDTDISRTVTITTPGGDYTDPDGDVHGSSSWEIFSDASLLTRVAYSLNDPDNLNSITVGAADMTFEGGLDGKGSLDPGVQYWVILTYYDEYGGESLAASTISFTTTATNLDPDAPVVASPAAGLTDVELNPTIQIAAYVDTDADPHASTDWEIYENAGLTDLVASSTADATNLTAITVDPANVTLVGSLAGSDSLARATDYWVVVRVSDSLGGTSTWSTPSNFRTGNYPEDDTWTLYGSGCSAAGTAVAWNGSWGLSTLLLPLLVFLAGLALLGRCSATPTSRREPSRQVRHWRK